MKVDYLKLYKESKQAHKEGMLGCPLATAIIQLVRPDEKSKCGKNCPFGQECFFDVIEDNSEDLIARIWQAIERTKNEK